MFDPEKVRQDFPILKRRIGGKSLVYLDSAATSQKPRQVIEAIKAFYEGHNANVHRGLYTLSQEASELYEEAHEKVAQFIRARTVEEVIFVKNTTEAINLVAYSLGLKNLGEGDEVVTTLMEHHSNIVPWEMLSRIKGYRVRYVKINEDGTLDYSDLEQLVNSRTKIVCINHGSNITGAVNDLKAISKLVHEHGGLIVVDGAQSVPHMPIDVEDLDVDFLAFSGHKMLAPTGIGVLYGKKEILNEMEPFLGGGGMIREVKYLSNSETCQIQWNELPWKFEAGTPNISGGIGLAEAVKYLERLGMENVYEHEKDLLKYALKRFRDLKKTEVYGPDSVSERVGIVPFNASGIEPHDLALLLDQYGIAVRSGFHCSQPLHQRLGLKGTTRASFYIYNTRYEIDRLIDALEEIEKSERIRS